jgi:GDPmannose 4,6-dehydratase
MSKRALITGLTGQDGSHLADLLLEKGYEVHGIVRRSSHVADGRIAHIRGQLQLHEADLTDQESLNRVMHRVRPDEVYNLAAMSFVGASWNQPILTSEVTGLGALRMLEAVRSCTPDARFYQASSSEMYGSAPAPQDENTPFHPRSPYGVAKAFAHHMTVNYRESYGMHASCGILFNHEGERRGEEFVTRKITKCVAELVAGKRSTFTLGNLDARRDWGYAPDYVNAMWLMLQQETPDDYVIATGETWSVADFVDAALQAAGISNSREELVTINPAFVRPAEVNELCGVRRKAWVKLGWAPTVSFMELVGRMVQADLEALGVDPLPGMATV